MGRKSKKLALDPLVFDHDRDEDGYYAFEDCEDLIETINPDAMRHGMVGMMIVTT